MTSENYKSERQRRGLSQAALAALVGVSRGCINYREAGHPRYPITREAWLAVSTLPLRGPAFNVKRIGGLWWVMLGVNKCYNAGHRSKANAVAAAMAATKCVMGGAEQAGSQASDDSTAPPHNVQS